MYEALRVVIDALSDNSAIEEQTADALFTVTFGIAARGSNTEAEAMRTLSRMHRVRALGLRAQIAILRDSAARHFQNKI